MGNTKSAQGALVREAKPLGDLGEWQAGGQQVAQPCSAKVVRNGAKTQPLRRQSAPQRRHRLFQRCRNIFLRCYPFAQRGQHQSVILFRLDVAALPKHGDKIGKFGLTPCRVFLRQDRRMKRIGGIIDGNAAAPPGDGRMQRLQQFAPPWPSAQPRRALAPDQGAGRSSSVARNGSPRQSIRYRSLSPAPGRRWG